MTRRHSELLILAAVLALSLTGCSRTPEDTLQDYVQRLGRSLQVDPVLWQVSLPAPLPSRRSLLLREPALSINVLEFLSLSGCELGRVLGANNSSLGKLAQPSQKLHLQRDLLLSAPQCIEILRADNPELADRLADLMQTKYKARMIYWWNAWFTAHEWRAFQSLSEGAILLPDDPRSDETLMAARQSLDYLLRQGERWQAGQFEYDSSAMERHQQQMLATAAIGRWRYANAALTAMSRAAADTLDKRIGARPLCPAGKKTPQAEILQNVFHKYYAGIVQPYLSLTDRFGSDLIHALSRVRKLAGEITPQEWRDLEETLKLERQVMLTEHRRHVTKWQDILAQCGMMPGSQAG